jgi:hypothetical protein
VRLSVVRGRTIAIGGGIWNQGPSLTVKDSTVVGNLALLGVDLYNLGVLNLNDSIVDQIGP